MTRTSSVVDVIPRQSLVLMLCANFVAILPHVPRLPVWLVALCGICLLYRIMVFRGAWSFPGKGWCAFLVLSGAASIIVHYGWSLGPEAGVALLIMSFAMKMLEIQRFRDAYLQVILAYFVVATQFLFSSSLYMAIYLYGVIVMITAALIGLNNTKQTPWVILRLSFFISLQALPIMLLLFVFFPRLPPLWALDMRGSVERSGLRDSMTPADIAKLGSMDQRAFRVQFAGEVPPQESLYWRGLVFSEFDGMTWSRANPAVLPTGHYFKNEGQRNILRQQSSFTRASLQSIGVNVQLPAVDYQVILEPTDQPYLFALDMPQTLQAEIKLNHDFTLSVNEPIMQTFSYSVRSFPNYQAQLQLNSQQRVSELQLPVASNPRSQALAQAWMREENNNPEQFSQRILRWFRDESFVYTLSPPSLKEHIVDQFLFDTRQGYCSFYAGAMVFLLRAAGVPARVVVGYMGGEVNPLGHYVVVNQFDAHAWVEMWVENKGWLRVDPTAAVAPERIRDSVQRGLGERSDFLKDYPWSMARYRHNSIIRSLWRAMDYTSFSWQRWVVGYGADKQQDFFKRYFEKISAINLAIAVLLAIAASLGLMAWFLLRQPTKLAVDALHSAYAYFGRWCAKQGLIRQPGETPLQFAQRVQRQNPSHSQLINQITQLYMAQQYNPPQLSSAKRVLAKQTAAKKLRQLIADLEKR